MAASAAEATGGRVRQLHCLGRLGLRLGPCRRLCLLAILITRMAVEAAPKRTSWASRGSRLEFQSLWFRDCDDVPNLPLHFGALVTKPKPGGGQLFDVNFTVARTAKQLRSVRVKIDKCRDRVSANTCEYFTTFNWRSNMCSLIVAPDMAWSYMINSIQPPVSCPIKKGEYQSVNASVNMESALAKNFMVDGVVWKGVLTANDHEDAAWMCLSAAVMTKRAH